MNQQQTPPGWYPDPAGGGGQRYWDGAQWTDQFQPPASPPAPLGGPPPIVTQPMAQSGPPPIVDQGWQQPAAKTVTPPPAAWLAAPILLGLLIIGCIGTWATVDAGFVNASVSGFDGDGGIVLGIGVVAAILLTIWRQSGSAALAWVAAGLSALNVLIAIIDIGSVDDEIPGPFKDQVDVGWGLWLTLVAAIGMTVLSVVLALNKRRR